MAFLGSAEMTLSSATADSEDDVKHQVDPIPQDNASSRPETEKDHHYTVDPTSDAKTKTKTKRTNFFKAIFKSPISSHQKKKTIGRRKIIEAQPKKDKEANSTMVLSSTLMIPDLDDPVTIHTASSDQSVRLSLPSEISMVYSKSKSSAHSRESGKRRVYPKKKEAQVQSTDRSTRPKNAAIVPEGQNRSLSGDSSSDEKGASLRARFQRFNDVEWGDLELCVVGVDKVDSLTLLRDRKARRRASFGGQPTFVNFDARPTPVVDLGSQRPKVCRRMSCGPLVSNRDDWGETEHPAIAAPPRWKKYPSLRKMNSRRRDKSRYHRGKPIDAL